MKTSRALKLALNLLHLERQRTSDAIVQSYNAEVRAAIEELEELQRAYQDVEES